MSHIPERFIVRKPSSPPPIPRPTAMTPLLARPQSPTLSSPPMSPRVPRQYTRSQNPVLPHPHYEQKTHWIDYLGGGSHAIWHLFIVLAMYQHRTGMRDLRGGVDGLGCLALWLYSDRHIHTLSTRSLYVDVLHSLSWVLSQSSLFSSFLGHVREARINVLVFRVRREPISIYHAYNKYGE